jgi:hypothetical protein
MKTFYRYIRPVKLNEHRLELETVPHGGVCLRFDEAPDGTLFFTHARCHHEELFSKAVAKRVADQRATNRQGLVGQPAPPTVPMAMDPTILTEEVIKAAAAWDPAWFDLGENFYMTYMKLELRELKNALEQLIESNKRELAKAEIWKAGIAAAKHGERYESLSR